MALINFYKGLESDYDSSLHNNSIYQCTDSGVVYILGVKHENKSADIFILEQDITVITEEIMLAARDTYNGTKACQFYLLTSTVAILGPLYMISKLNDNQYHIYFIQLTETGGEGLKNNITIRTWGASILNIGLPVAITDYIYGKLPKDTAIEEYVTNLVGTNTYTGANYISKETNLTDAAMQLDEEIKATNDNIDILNAATVKGVATISASNKVEILNGIAVIPLLSDNNSGVLDVSYYRFINNSYDANIPILGSNSSGDYIFAGYKDDNGLRLPITSTLDPDTTEYLYIMYANESNGGLMSSTDYEKLNNIENTYVPLTGDSFKNNNACWGGTKTTGETVCLAFINTQDIACIGNTTLPLTVRGTNIMYSNGIVSNPIYHAGNFIAGTDYVAPSALNSYLPLSGGTITGVVKHSANVDLDNGKYIQAYTTSGSLYPILFIDSGNDFVVGSNGTETRIRSNDTNLIHDTTSGRYTIYDSYNLDITKWNISQLTTSVDNVTSSGIKYYNVADGDVENLPIEDSSYGIVSTFAKLDNNNPGTNNTWGFQLANPNNSDSLWYRNFKGLTKNSWKELATVDQINNLQLEDIVSYGIEWDTEVSDPDCTRIGNLSLHKSLPIQSKMRGCVAKGNNIQYYLNPTDWSQKEDGTPSVLDGTDGDVMVHIPKFWIKSGSNNTKRWVKIATNYIDETWTEVPEMLISAYRVTTDRTDGENIKLMSVVNNTENFAGSFGVEDPTNTYRTALGKPRTTMSRQTARTYAHNKQDGTELLCYEYYKDVLYWLPVIEYATFNIQQAFNDELTSEGYHLGGLGAGVTNLGTYIWKSYGGNYYPVTPMGYTNDLGNFTGTKELNLGTYSFTSKTSTDWNIWRHNYDYIAHTYENNVMTVTNVMSDGYACSTGFYDIGGDMTVTIQGLQEGQSVIFRASSGMEDVEVSTNEQVVIPWPQSNVSRYIYFGFTGECNITLTIDANPAVEYSDLSAGTTNVIRYRGIENIFGDIWTNLEGVIIKYDNHASGTHDVYTTTNSEYFQDSATDNMELIGTETTSEGYVKEFDLGDKANIIPSICTGASGTTYKCDYHYTNNLGSNLGTFLAGGHARHGAGAGLGSLYSYASAADSYVNVGFRTVNILN